MNPRRLSFATFPISPASRFAVVVFIAALVFGVTAPVALAAHKKGDLVAIEGRVVDALGAPLENITIVLEATRKSFSYSHLERRVDGVLRRPTAAAANGEFHFDWRWDKQYKKLEVIAGVPGANGEIEVLARQDITAPARAQSKVVTALLIDEFADLDLLRRIIDGTATIDERKLFSELGRPDRFEKKDGEHSWWYFEQGRVYRFRDGKLEQVVPFTPVTE